MAPSNPIRNRIPNMTVRIIPARLPSAKVTTMATPIAPASIKNTKNTNCLSIMTPPLQSGMKPRLHYIIFRGVNSADCINTFFMRDM